MSATTMDAVASTTRAARTTRFSRSSVLRGLLAMGGVVGIGATLTLATYTDSGAAASTFSSGTLDIKINAVDGNPTAYNFASLTTSGMKPGTTTYALLPVTNAGTLGFTYGMGTTVANAGTNSTADTALGSALQIGVVKVSGTTCDVTSYGSGTGYSTLGTAASAAFSAKQLNVGAGDNLCFQATLPSGSGNASQGGVVTTTFTFTATQN